MAVADNMKVAATSAYPSQPSHVEGVREGNQTGSYEKEPGHLPNGRATARRSTGINARARNPIDPRMPALSPA